MSASRSANRVLQELIKGIQGIRTYWKPITTAVLILLAIVGVIIVPDRGFGEVNRRPADYYRPPKTLWDLLNLLVVPLGLGLTGAVVGYLLSAYQKRREEDSQQKRFQEERDAQERRFREEKDSQEKRVREEALQDYLDVMTQLMLKEGLRSSDTAVSPHVQHIARYRTLTVLRELDAKRKATVLRFLYESELIGGRPNLQRIVNLEGADLGQAELCRVKLSDAHLENVDLHRADLSGANLNGAVLYGANLHAANLRGAKLAKADFTAANLSNADLTGAAEYTHDQLRKATWTGIKPPDLERSLCSQPTETARLPERDDWLISTGWLKTTDTIIHETPREYHDDGNERHGEWVVTRGRHRIERLENFRVGIYLVTNELFFQFVLDRGYDRVDEFWKGVPTHSKKTFMCQDGRSPGPSTWPSGEGFPKGLPNHPVAGISYYEALAFCRWLQAVHPEDGWTWCLPTENMWELVARPEDAFLYPWGARFERDRCNSVEARFGETTKVGLFEKGRSNSGCFDMAGNVWEFVSEDEEEHWYCVLRGGSYRNSGPEVKSTLRLWGVPREHRPPDFGFRCAAIRNRAQLH